MSENANEIDEQVQPHPAEMTPDICSSPEGETAPEAEKNSDAKDRTEGETVSKDESDFTNDSADSPAASENGNDEAPAPTSKKKLTKKKRIILIGVAIVAIIIGISLIPSKFETVQNKCVKIAGSIATGKGYFKIETIPDSWDNMDSSVRALMLSSHQKSALEAIKYANEALDFSESVYSDMMNTTALMGRQTEENSKYKVSWTYHPDDGLTVTYTKK